MRRAASLAADLAQLQALLAAEVQFRRRNGNRRTEQTIAADVLVAIGMPTFAGPLQALREMEIDRLIDEPAAPRHHGSGRVVHLHLKRPA